MSRFIYVARNTSNVGGSTRAFRSLSMARQFGLARYYTSTGHGEILGYATRADMHADRDGARPDLIVTWIDIIRASSYSLRDYLEQCSDDRNRAVGELMEIEKQEFDLSEIGEL